MTISRINLVMDVKISWWLKYLYIPTLILFAKFCMWINSNSQPNWDRINKVISKGVKVSNPRTVYDKQ